MDASNGWSAMDASNREVLVSGVDALSLAVDYHDDDLYWANHLTGNVECISLNGRIRRLISARGLLGKYAEGVAVSASHVYRTSNLPRHAINGMTKTGSDVKSHILPNGSQQQDLFGIAYLQPKSKAQNVSPT
ncbi:hypothetical protein BV898_15013 [Hypsibius exemplaris]|uniref:Uncharacterized protein n=1 Tax=Hypsibius exemplaris TaxID=2072580 RepID=A0A9X6NAM3_HYPEX|nr:hypothetical protein BV898_15013 [Hypsibius exemplaris]